MRLICWMGLACAVAYAPAGLTAAAAHAAPPLRPAAHTTVLPPSEGPVLARGRGRDFWTPRAADLRRLEAGLPRSLTGYYRQYVGITQGGKRLILINGFKAGVAPAFTGGQGDWHRHAVIVSDGGDDFFQATYDPHTRRFVGPEFNGQG